MAGLTALEVLDLGGVALMGSVLPDWLGNLTSLRKLVLVGPPPNLSSGRGPSGTIPLQWKYLTSLRHLELRHFPLLDFHSRTLEDIWGPYGLSNLQNLTLSDFGSSCINYEDLAIVLGHSNANLETMVLSGVDETGHGSGCVFSTSGAWSLSFLTNYSQLRILRMHRATHDGQGGLIGGIPNEWKHALFKLEELSLPAAGLNGTLPDWLPNILADNAVLDLRGNNFSGPLPSTWGNIAGFTGFTQLWLDGNQLGGNLPASWASLMWSSVSVSLGGQRGWGGNLGGFEGPLPAEWLSSSVGDSYEGSRLVKLDMRQVYATIGC
ncbi:hypothetical protein PLESTM_001375800 [Pleodorina starrii]|nr:hypothetical protein PLESTM_001375800 [Pleodorina starrii]